MYHFMCTLAKILSNCLGIASILIGYGFYRVLEDPADGIKVCLMFVGIGLVLLFRGQISALWKTGIRAGKQQADERRKASWERDPSLRVKYYTLNCYMEAGLPLAKDTFCTVNFDGDTIDIEGGGMKFSLNYSKVTDIKLRTKTEVQHFLVSSAGGALLGNEMFGPVGAAIGGRIQHQTIEEDIKYVLITYLNETKPQYLLFRFTYDWLRVKKIIEEQLGKISTETVHIEL